MLIGNLTNFPDMRGAHQAAAAAPDSEYLVAGFRHMHQNTGFQNIMIQPFAFVFGDNRWIKVRVFSRADVRNSVFHRFVSIIA